MHEKTCSAILNGLDNRWQSVEQEFCRSHYFSNSNNNVQCVVVDENECLRSGCTWVENEKKCKSTHEWCATHSKEDCPNECVWSNGARKLRDTNWSAQIAKEIHMAIPTVDRLDHQLQELRKKMIPYTSEPESKSEFAWSYQSAIENKDRYGYGTSVPSYKYKIPPY